MILHDHQCWTLGVPFARSKVQILHVCTRSRDTAFFLLPCRSSQLPPVSFVRDQSWHTIIYAPAAYLAVQPPIHLSIPLRSPALPLDAEQHVRTAGAAQPGLEISAEINRYIRYIGFIGGARYYFYRPKLIL